MAEPSFALQDILQFIVECKISAVHYCKSSDLQMAKTSLAQNGAPVCSIWSKRTPCSMIVHSVVECKILCLHMAGAIFALHSS